MAKDLSLEGLERMWGTETGRMQFSEYHESMFTGEAVAPPEEPDIVELTPREIEALLAAMFLIEDGEVAKRLGISHQEAVLALNSVYKKLKDD